MHPSADRPGVLAPPPVIFLAAIVAGGVLQYLWPVALAAPWPARALGALLILGALALSAWGIVTLKRAGTTVNPHRPATALVQSGPYRYTRNPLYLALALGQLGLAFVLAWGWILILWPLAIMVVNQGVIVREERYLEKTFGEAYRTYRRHVRRWL